LSQNGYRERVLIKVDAESGQKVLSDAELLSERSEKQVRRRASTTRPTHSTDKAQKAAGKHSTCRISEAKVFLRFDTCLCSSAPPQDQNKTMFLQRDSYVLRWDFYFFQWDSLSLHLGFILCGFFRWDLSVPELNIYYYIAAG
jgi:hypothetical protein